MGHRVRHWSVAFSRELAQWTRGLDLGGRPLRRLEAQVVGPICAGLGTAGVVRAGVVTLGVETAGVLTAGVVTVGVLTPCSTLS